MSLFFTKEGNWIGTWMYIHQSMKKIKFTMETPITIHINSLKNYNKTVKYRKGREHFLVLKVFFFSRLTENTHGICNWAWLLTGISTNRSLTVIFPKIHMSTSTQVIPSLFKIINWTIFISGTLLWAVFTAVSFTTYQSIWLVLSKPQKKE